MINNSSLRKWERLSQKQLDQQFMNEMIHGLQTDLASHFSSMARLV